MVLYIGQVDRMIYTVIIAILTYLIVKFLSNYIIIFGKRRFVVLIIISLFINLLLEFLLNSLSINLLNVSIIGYTIAGIIANDLFKQGIKRTIPALVIVVAILELIVIVINQIGV